MIENMHTMRVIYTAVSVHTDKGDEVTHDKQDKGGAAGQTIVEDDA